MHIDYCVHQHICAERAGEFLLGSEGQAFEGLAHAQGAIARTRATMLAKNPSQDWNHCVWLAKLVVYRRSELDPDSIAIDFELCRRRQASGDKPIYELGEDDRYLCLTDNGLQFFTDHGPEAGATALHFLAYDRWVPSLTDAGGLDVTWLDLYTGRITTAALALTVSTADGIF